MQMTTVCLLCDWLFTSLPSDVMRFNILLVFHKG